MRSVFILLILFSSAAFAKNECQKTIDERFVEVENSSMTEAEKAVPLVKLLNEAYTPYLQDFKKAVMQWPAEEIRKLSADLHRRLRDEETSGALFDSKDPDHFNKGFHGVLKVAALNMDYKAGYTPFNKAVVAKMIRAGALAEYFMAKHFPPKDYFAHSSYLLRHRTFVKEDIAEQMYYGILSVVQSTANLTADPVQKRPAEAILEGITKEQGDHPSLIVMYSLMLPPRLLGQNTRIYYANPLKEVKDQLEFTVPFRLFVKGYRDRQSARSSDTVEPYELNKGCPVGHRLPGCEKPSLQDFVEAIMYIYKQLD